MRRRLGLELELALISTAEVDLQLRSKRGTEAEDHGREERNNNNNNREQAGGVVVVVDDGDADLDRKRLNKAHLLHQLVVVVVVVIAMRTPISTTTATA